MLICYFGRYSKHHNNMEDFKTLICYCRRNCRNLENVKILGHCGAYFYYSSKLVTTLLVLIILQFWKELQEIFKIMEFNSNHTEDIFIFEQISKDVFNIERHYCLKFVKIYTECQISPCQYSLCYPSSCRPSSC